MLWVWAAVMGLMTVAITYPHLVEHRGVPPGLFLVFGMVLLLGVSAFGVRKQKRPFNFIAVVAGLLWIVFLQGANPPVRLLGTLLNVVAVASVALNWRRFS